MPGQSKDVETVIDAILAEIFGVMGLARQAWARRVLEPFLRFPSRLMAEMLVDLDHDIARLGWCAAAGDFLTRFVRTVQVSGAESLPKNGPLLVASNHPAAYDVVILSKILGREDLKIISSDITVISRLPSIYPHFIFVTKEPHQRMAAVRSALRHLLEDGALLIFPRGEVEPDPAISPGALLSLERWSLSLDLMLRKAPQTQTVVTIVSGVLSQHWFRNPILRLWKSPEQRQKIAEILQVIQQLVWSSELSLNPAVAFSSPLPAYQLAPVGATPGSYLGGIKAQAYEMLSGRPLTAPNLPLHQDDS